MKRRDSHRERGAARQRRNDHRAARQPQGARRSDHETARRGDHIGRRDSGGAAKVAERGEKMRLFRTSRRCANFPVCPPTSAGGQENSTPRRPPFPFLRFRWGAGRPMKRPTAPTSRPPPFPFFKISLGGRTTHETANRTPLPGDRHSLF